MMWPELQPNTKIQINYINQRTELGEHFLAFSKKKILEYLADNDTYFSHFFSMFEAKARE